MEGRGRRENIRRGVYLELQYNILQYRRFLEMIFVLLVLDGSFCCRELLGFIKMSIEIGFFRFEVEESSGSLVFVFRQLFIVWMLKVQLLIWGCSRVFFCLGICDRGNFWCYYSICVKEQMELFGCLSRFDNIYVG